MGYLQISHFLYNVIVRLLNMNKKRLNEIKSLLNNIPEHDLPILESVMNNELKTEEEKFEFIDFFIDYLKGKDNSYNEYIYNESLTEINNKINELSTLTKRNHLFLETTLDEYQKMDENISNSLSLASSYIDDKGTLAYFHTPISLQLQQIIFKTEEPDFILPFDYPFFLCNYAQILFADSKYDEACFQLNRAKEFDRFYLKPLVLKLKFDILMKYDYKIDVDIERINEVFLFDDDIYSFEDCLLCKQLAIKNSDNSTNKPLNLIITPPALKKIIVPSSFNISSSVKKALNVIYNNNVTKNKDISLFVYNTLIKHYSDKNKVNEILNIKENDNV